ncbi:hypothetical protein Tco_1050431, partial [Tanacetum coccineum]
AARPWRCCDTGGNGFDDGDGNNDGGSDVNNDDAW